MIRFLIIGLILSLASCASSQEEQPQTVEQPTTTQQVKKSGLKKLEKNSVPASRQPIRSTARPPSQIEQNYPYDIDLKMADGTVIKSDELLKSDGKPTVVLFWLTTCVPCRYEMKAIEEKYSSWEQEADFNLYAISTDFQKNYEAFVKRVNDANWPWESYNDMNREFRSVMPGELNGLPQTFVFDKDGKIVYHKRKYRSGDEDKLFEVVKSLSGKS